jgi:hypothetical protein
MTINFQPVYIMKNPIELQPRLTKPFSRQKPMGTDLTENREV